jgi:hypothetical protein
VILARIKRASSVKDCARAIAKRSWNGKARVALARKLSVILHSVWRSGEPFRWSEHAHFPRHFRSVETLRAGCNPLFLLFEVVSVSPGNHDLEGNLLGPALGHGNTCRMA